MTRQKIIGGAVLTASLSLAFWLFFTNGANLAPAAIFTTLRGENIALTELKGKPTLVTFWASDCPGCIEEIPHLIQLHEQFHSQGLTIIAVAMHYDPPNRVKTLAEARQLPYPVALDIDASHARAFGNVQLTPSSFLIDQNGSIVMHKVGVFDLADMQKRLNDLLTAAN